MIIVGVVAKRPVTQLGLAAAITAEESWRVGCCAPSALEFVARLEANSCSVVLCDLGPGSEAGFDLNDDLAVLQARYFTIVAISPTAVEGVAATIDPDASIAVLRAAVIDAHTNRPGADSFCTSRLSSRELEVLVLIGGGLANKQIAGSLSISPSTVKRHIENLMDKSGRRTRAALAVLANEVGHVRPETLAILDRESVTEAVARA